MFKISCKYTVIHERVKHKSRFHLNTLLLMCSVCSILGTVVYSCCNPVETAHTLVFYSLCIAAFLCFDADYDRWGRDNAAHAERTSRGHSPYRLEFKFRLNLSRPWPGVQESVIGQPISPVNLCSLWAGVHWRGQLVLSSRFICPETSHEQQFDKMPSRARCMSPEP